MKIALNEDHDLIDFGKAKGPLTWHLSQLNGPSASPSGRQDLNLRPLDPQSCAPGF
jgi:hypothetical protein